MCVKNRPSGTSSGTSNAQHILQHGHQQQHSPCNNFMATAQICSTQTVMGQLHQKVLELLCAYRMSKSLSFEQSSQFFWPYSSGTFPSLRARRAAFSSFTRAFRAALSSGDSFLSRAIVAAQAPRVLPADRLLTCSQRYLENRYPFPEPRTKERLKSIHRGRLSLRMNVCASGLASC